MSATGANFGAFKNQGIRKPGEATGISPTVDADGSQVQVARHLPTVYTDGQDQGGHGGRGQNPDLAANLKALRETGVVRTAQNLKKSARPTAPQGEVVALATGKLPVSYAVKGSYEHNRVRHWDGNGKMLPLNGRPISVQGEAFMAGIPVGDGSIPSEWNKQMQYGMTTVRLNQGNPMEHRMPVYGLSGGIRV